MKKILLCIFVLFIVSGCANTLGELFDGSMDEMQYETPDVVKQPKEWQTVNLAKKSYFGSNNEVWNWTVLGRNFNATTNGSHFRIYVNNILIDSVDDITFVEYGEFGASFFHMHRKLDKYYFYSDDQFVAQAEEFLHHSMAPSDKGFRHSDTLVRGLYKEDNSADNKIVLIGMNNGKAQYIVDGKYIPHTIKNGRLVANLSKQTNGYHFLVGFGTFDNETVYYVTENQSQEIQACYFAYSSIRC
ncbi:MAG: hypothetical protein ACI8Y7_000690 [Candidatus Woesearchaeota archaeon]|jgi:hypothetical protein